MGYAHTGDIEVLDAELAEFTKEPKFVGVRNIVPLEVPGWLGKPSVCEGMKVLQKYGLAYDLLVSPLWSTLSYSYDQNISPNAL